MATTNMAPVVRPEPDTDLLGDVQAYLDRYVELPTPEHSLVLAVWVIHTWCFKAAFVTPYIYISSDGPSCGKTRTMDVLGTLVRNADSGTDSPPHVLGQEIAANSPTLFFDEMDTVYAGSANNGNKRILNIGYQRGAVIKRQRANTVEVWSVFCAKVLAGIRNNHLPASLLSRCIPIEMQPRTRELERFNKFHVLRDPRRRDLVDRVAAFGEEFLLDIANQRPEPMKALDDRQNEITEPLLQIASVLGQEREVRGALARVYRSDTSRQSSEQVFMTRIKACLIVQEANGGPADRIFSSDLCAGLGPMYNPDLLAKLLAEMGFVRTQPETFRVDTKVKRGYFVEDLQPLFDRWLDEEASSAGLELIDGGAGDDAAEEVA